MSCPLPPSPSSVSTPSFSLPFCSHQSLFLLALPLTIAVFCLSSPESHFLTKLHSLKMLSITPSQLENGKKITTYDYRCVALQAFSCGAPGLGCTDVGGRVLLHLLWGDGGKRVRGSCERGKCGAPALCRQRGGTQRGNGSKLVLFKSRDCS